jgi:hypothetical protein
MAEDEVVITYGDTTLYKSDVALLQPGQWLNDSLISFWFEYAAPSLPLPSECPPAHPAPCALDVTRYLARERFSEHQDDLLFVDPSAMFMINFSDGAALAQCVRGWRLCAWSHTHTCAHTDGGDAQTWTRCVRRWQRWSSRRGP